MVILHSKRYTFLVHLRSWTRMRFLHSTSRLLRPALSILFHRLLVFLSFWSKTYESNFETITLIVCPASGLFQTRMSVSLFDTYFWLFKRGYIKYIQSSKYRQVVHYVICLTKLQCIYPITPVLTQNFCHQSTDSFLVLLQLSTFVFIPH